MYDEHFYRKYVNISFVIISTDTILLRFYIHSSEVCIKLICNDKVQGILVLYKNANIIIILLKEYVLPTIHPLIFEDVTI